MSRHIDKHKPGSFDWVELVTTDQPAMKKFYTALFGWAVEDSPIGGDEFYSMFKLEGRNVGAGYSLPKDQREQGVPSHWGIYIAVASTDASAERAAQLGGKILAPPFDVMDYGRMAVIQDPTGAIFSIWQDMTHTGIGIAGVDGTLCWADLSTHDPATASKFYSALFGWKIAAGEHDTSGYQHIANGEDFIGGVHPPGRHDPNVPPHWLTYFLTSNCDATAAKAKQLGAKFFVEPMTMEQVGRMAVLADPQGAIFAIFQPMRK
jgi:predicted enzyme related to lactoylglutathione lyase